MKELQLELRRHDETDETVSVPVDRLVNCGFTGRNEEEVRKHIEELEKEGVTAPDEFPVVYPKPFQLLTTRTEFEVLSESTSGEAEFVLFPGDDETYVGVGSDHTDRELESDDILVSKTVCPNVVSDAVWPLSEVADHWDELKLRSWTGTERELYQDAALSAILPPEELLGLVDETTTEGLSGTALFSGSVGTETEQLVYSETFTVELFDPVLDRSLSVSYEAQPIDWMAE